MCQQTVDQQREQQKGQALFEFGRGLRFGFCFRRLIG